MNIAVITGASGGLGCEITRQLCDHPGSIDEVWLIARSLDKLKLLADELPIHAVPIPLDLSDIAFLTILQEKLEVEKPNVQMLINNAGYGKIGAFKDIPIFDAAGMVDLNCRAPLLLTHLILPYMPKGSRIMNICSTASFQPFPYLSVYAASKSFLYRWSRSLWHELFPYGISVTAVCPYWIKDTNFIPVAQSTEDAKAISHFPLASRVKTVARLALTDTKLRLPVSTPGPVCLIHRIAAKFIPSEIMMAIWAILRRV